MYIWGRFIAHALTASRRPPLAAPFGVSELTLRAWPADCDPNLHVNNGRYATIADLGRYDLLTRTGIWQAARKNRLAPIMGGGAISFRREIRMWRRFSLATRIIGWEGTRLVCEQRFAPLPDHDAEAQTAVLFLTASGFYDRAAGRFEPVETVFERIGIAAEAPAGDAMTQTFLAGLDGLRRHAAETP